MANKLFVGVTFVGLALLILSPAAVWAQTGTIAGAVKDATGAVLPGVTVEATSPALIEKVRTVVTDGQGQYKIVDLRPGVYTVTFSLVGFSTLKREGLELTTGSTLNVGGEMSLGTVEETIIVSGATPMVDIQSVVQHRVITGDVIEKLPAARAMQSYGVLIPGVTAVSYNPQLGAQDVGGNVGDTFTILSIHGSRGTEMPLLLDGMRSNNVNGTGGGAYTNFMTNTGSVQEFAIDVGSHSAESMVSGVRANVIPKHGGNIFVGSLFGTFTNHNLQANNIDSALRARGLAQQASTDKIWDVNPSAGGPIKRDRLWFYTAFRRFVIDDAPPGAFYSQDPLALVYVPDLNRPAINHFDATSMNVRLTWQATPRNKLGFFFDNQRSNRPREGLASNKPVEATTKKTNHPQWLTQATWNSPVTDKLLFDAGVTAYYDTINNESLDGSDRVADTTYSVTELSTGTTYRAAPSYRRGYYFNVASKANMTYVTGSHAFKVGMQALSGYLNQSTRINNDTTLQFRNGVPVQATINTTPFTVGANVKMDLGLFAQDQWTIKRLTLNMGLRFDYLNAYVPEQHVPAARYVGARDFAPVPNVPNWKDLSPRLGGSYDVFGNGKTAVKVAVGKYLQANLTVLAGASNPVNTSVNSTTRPWIDLNHDFIPQENELGPLANPDFGKLKIGTAYDPAYLNGWGTRGDNWEVQMGLQHEVRPGLSVHAEYTRHWFGNFVANDNVLVAPSDYSPFCVTAPTDSRLPGGGGNEICGFYDINPDKFGQVQNLLTSSDKYGKVSDVYNGVDLSVNLRLPRGITLQGGTSTGHEVLDVCDLAGKVDNPASTTQSAPLGGGLTGFTGANPSNVPSPSTLYCHIAPPFQTQVKLLGVYPLPWWGLAVSATFQSLPGPEISAAHVVTNAEVAPSLGRNLAGGARVTTVQLIAPGTVFGDRLNQVDTRVTKTFNIRRARVTANADVANLLNANPVLSQNNTYGAAWLRPTIVLPGRIFKASMQINF